MTAPAVSRIAVPSPNRRTASARTMAQPTSGSVASQTGPVQLRRGRCRSALHANTASGMKTRQPTKRRLRACACAGLGKPPGLRGPPPDEEERQDRDRERRGDEQDVLQHVVQAEARVGAETSPGLEPERGPVVRVVPVRDRSEQRDRDQDGEVGLGSKKPGARTPVQDAERKRGEAQREDRVLREQPEAQRDSRAVPRSVFLPDERPVQEIQRRRPRGSEGCVRGDHQARREEGIRDRRGERRRHRARRSGPRGAGRADRRSRRPRRRTRSRRRGHSPRHARRAPRRARSATPPSVDGRGTRSRGGSSSSSSRLPRA